MMVDADSKYLYNGFPYLGKDDTRDTSVSVPTDVAMKLIRPPSNTATTSRVTTFSHLWILLYA